MSPEELRIDAHQHYWKLAWSDYTWMQPHKASAPMGLRIWRPCCKRLV